MFDIAPSEMLVVVLVAIIFIGPKDLPRVMRFVGQWVGKGRAMARHFRSAMDDMVREVELAEMEKKWQAENERIMREHAEVIEGMARPVEPAATVAPPALVAPVPANAAEPLPLPPAPASRSHQG